MGPRQAGSCAQDQDWDLGVVTALHTLPAEPMHITGLCRQQIMPLPQSQPHAATAPRSCPALPPIQLLNTTPCPFTVPSYPSSHAPCPIPSSGYGAKLLGCLDSGAGSSSGQETESSHCTTSALLCGQGWKDQLHAPQLRLLPTPGLGMTTGPVMGWTKSHSELDLAHGPYFTHPWIKVNVYQQS